MDPQQQADRDRMKVLLVEAISTLCRNGLQYKEQLSVEGLIGITLDKSDVFLVSVRETFSLASAVEEAKETREKTQNVHSPGSRRGSKRPSIMMQDSGPSEKNKRKSAPKQISAAEVDMLNNSPAEVRSPDFNEDSVGASDGIDERLGAQLDNDYIDQSDHRTRKKMEDEEDDDDDDIVYVEPDLAIKQEKIKGESDQNSCMFDSSPSVFNDSPQTVSRPPPPLRQRPDPNDLRNSHPSGLDSDQLALAYSTPIKQEQGSEIINVPGTVNNFPADHSPVPVSMVSTGGTQPLEGLDNMQAYPVEWGNQSAQEFIPMPGDDSNDQSLASQQASVSGGASQQQRGSMSVIEETTQEGTKYRCPKCSKVYRHRCHAYRHISQIHSAKNFVCDVCGKGFSGRGNLLRHQAATQCGSLTLDPFMSTVKDTEIQLYNRLVVAQDIAENNTPEPS